MYQMTSYLHVGLISVAMGFAAVLFARLAMMVH